MSKCVDEDALNTVINRYLKRRNYTIPTQSSLLNENKFTIRELIANEILNIGSYDHLIGYSSTPTSTKLDYLNNCNKCIDEFVNFLDKLNLDNEQSLSFSFSIFIHFFIDLFQNDLKQEAKSLFTNHLNKFSSFNQLKKTIDMINNSIKNQQLDKRLVKLRNSKISITLYESDHRHLLVYLENESLSKNLHQIINANFSFTIIPDLTADNMSKPVKFKKLSTNSIGDDYAADNPSKNDNETKFKEFNPFKSNDKIEPTSKEDDPSLANDNKMQIDTESNESTQLKTSEELEFDELINSLSALKPQLPEVLAYKLSTNDSHICCADLRSDLKYACAGNDNSELLIFPNLEFKPIWNSNAKSKWIDDQEPDLIEEKAERNQAKSYSFFGHHGSIVDCKFIPNTNYLLTCSTDTDSILWNLNERDNTQSNYLVKKYYGHTQPIYSLDVNCLGTHFATGSKDHTSRLFCLDRSNLVRSFVGHQNSLNCVHFHPNSKYLSTGSSDHSIRMWDISLSNMVRVFSCQTEIYSLCYSPCGKFLASAGTDNKIKIWDLTMGKQLTELNSSHTKPINSLSFNSTSSVLVSSSTDQQINFWNFKMIKQNSSPLRNEDQLLLMNKNLLIKVRRAKFTHTDLLVTVGT